jgi:flagellin
LYNSEFVELSDYIAKASTKEFNGVPLFSSTNLDVTVDSDGGVFTMTGIDLSTSAYTDATSSTIDTLANAKNALTTVKATINQLSADRASIGSSQSRLNLTLDQLSIVAENLTSASSRIKDVDVAEESANYAKQSILVQTGTAMLVQANQMPQTVLKLLQ